MGRISLDILKYRCIFERIILYSSSRICEKVTGSCTSTKINTTCPCHNTVVVDVPFKFLQRNHNYGGFKEKLKRKVKYVIGKLKLQLMLFN